MIIKIFFECNIVTGAHKYFRKLRCAREHRVKKPVSMVPSLAKLKKM